MKILRGVLSSFICPLTLPPYLYDITYLLFPNTRFWFQHCLPTECTIPDASISLLYLSLARFQNTDYHCYIYCLFKTWQL